MDLGIKGNEMIGDEVIKLLKMLGGKYRYALNGGDDYSFYYIDNYNDIVYSYIGPDEIKGYKIFSLEDFLKKYPYKVGDKVKIYVQNDNIEGCFDIEVAEITSMRWDPLRCRIVYKMKDTNREFCVEDIKDKVIDIAIKTTKDIEEKKINQILLANCDLDEVEIVLGDRFELKIEDGKYYAVRKKPKYPTTYEEDNYCETLEIKVLGYKVGDVVFTNHAGWIRITNKLWDCYAKEHVYEGIGVLNEQEYNNISHKDIINKMETDSVIENMNESITPSPYITANITDKNNCDIKCPDGYEFHDENGNLIGNKVMMVLKKPKYPTDFDECRALLHLQDSMIESRCGYEYKLISYFQRLLTCRDAYWKIAGEELGLDKPWKPDSDTEIYNIYRVKNTMYLGGACWVVIVIY